MYRLAFLFLTFSLLVERAGASDNSGNGVAIVYNNAVPESKKVADRYAEKRKVPANQIMGLDLPSSEVITRDEFKDRLQKPLFEFLQKQRFWTVDKHVQPVTDWTAELICPV